MTTRPLAKRRCTACNKPREPERFTVPQGRTCDLCRKRKQKAAARERHLSKTYSITVAEFEALAASGCQICGGSRPYNLHVDHDHAIAERFTVRESVRGVLCKRCNKLLRDVGDSTELLRAAAIYLDNPPAKKVLFP